MLKLMATDASSDGLADSKGIQGVVYVRLTFCLFALPCKETRKEILSSKTLREPENIIYIALYI